VDKKRDQVRELKIQRPKRAKLSAKESLKRLEGFSKRKEKFIASVREDHRRT